MRLEPWILVMVVLLMTFVAGCTTSSSSPPPPPYQSSSSIRAVLAGATDEWSLSLGCHAIVTGYAYNTGSATVNNVVVFLTLYYSDETIRDSRTVFIGPISPQESGNFKVILDRECGEEYTIGVTSTP